jgi:nitrogen fixation NifU-like protein
MSELRDLYQQVILDHNRAPRNFRRIAGPSCTAEGHNPLCGDRIVLDLVVQDGVVKDAAFQGAGCAISKAAASMMTASVIGKREAEVDALFHRVHAMLTGDADAADVGKLAVFAGVREFPSRVKCAMLAWHTLQGPQRSRRARLDGVAAWWTRRRSSARWWRRCARASTPRSRSTSTSWA